MYVLLQPGPDIIIALDNYKTWLRRLNKKWPSVQESEKNCEKAYEDLVELLKRDSFAIPVQRIFKNFPEVDLKEAVKNPEYLNVEIHMMNDIEKISANKAKTIIFNIVNSLDNIPEDRINSIEMLLGQVISFHTTFMPKYRETRELERKEKKKKRRELIASAGYFCSGIGIVTANALATIPTIIAGASLGLGGGATLKGFWDLVRIV